MYRKALRTFITTMFLGQPVYAEVSAAEIDDCLERGLNSILAAQNVEQYAVISNITRNVVGRPWGTLSEVDQETLQAIVLDTIKRKLHERGAEFQGATVGEITVVPSKDWPHQYTISGELLAHGIPYWFQTIANISKDRCRFYTLNIENMFTLSGWLREQPAVREKMKALGLKL